MMPNANMGTENTGVSDSIQIRRVVSKRTLSGERRDAPGEGGDTRGHVQRPWFSELFDPVTRCSQRAQGRRRPFSMEGVQMGEAHVRRGSPR